DAVVKSSGAISDVAVHATGGFPVTRNEGPDRRSPDLATFTDPAGAEALADYSASIDWGDGNTSAGTISFDSGSGVFTVAGSNTYAEEGNYTVTVTITHSPASYSFLTNTPTITHLTLDP